MGTIVIIYLVVLLIVLLAGGAGIYHGIKFGLPGDRSRLGIIAYISAVLVIIIASFIVLGSLNALEAA
jgi:hypothetical protein